MATACLMLDFIDDLMLALLMTKRSRVKVHKICEYCSSEFMVNFSRRNTARYCSCSCTNRGEFSKREKKRLKVIKSKPAHNNRKQYIPCILCGKIFGIPQCRIGKRKYCSHFCKIEHSRKPVPDKRYIRVRVNGKRMLEHRYKIEKKIGRKLAPDETVDHINRNRHDNRLRNLRILSRQEHGRISSSYQKSPAPWRASERNKQ